MNSTSTREVTASDVDVARSLSTKSGTTGGTGVTERTADQATWRRPHPKAHHHPEISSSSYAIHRRVGSIWSIEELVPWVFHGPRFVPMTRGRQAQSTLGANLGFEALEPRA